MPDAAAIPNAAARSDAAASPEVSVPLDAAFYFDLGNPFAYLAAEQVLQLLPLAAQWQPVLARELGSGADSFALRCEHEADALAEDLARRARELDLQPLRLPQEFPFDSEPAMLAATYAKAIGRAVPFAQAAFRQAFAGGRSLAEPDNVLLAAAACEMHPRAVLTAMQSASTRTQLRDATATAAQAGVGEVPAIRVGERVWMGERALPDAAAHLAQARSHG